MEAYKSEKRELASLIALLAGSGLRIGEALALTTQDDGVANLWDPQKATILVRATRVRGKVQPAPKTVAGERTVNLDPRLNNLLTALGRTGFLFPKHYSTYARHFQDLGLTEGFHALRRFRVTHLEDVSAPPMLVKYLVGHAAKGVTERYIKQTEERQQRAAEVGLGFEL